ncbi:MAG: prephenate dehydrogenase/arogenate dehydrogenase family protein [Sphaerochaeta sp.]|jgi:arogenate dehydrogenase (NADP+)|nr:prephenate dehydrogenase/arogenate dehydrogenase family protein [Sphaerochaeta sp.]
MEAVKTVGVYGLGRFGVFWAEELARHGFDVVAYSRSSKATPTGVRLVSEDEVLTASALFYCVSISSFEGVLERTASRIGKETVVMDTCSVKLHPAEVMRRVLGDEIECIATHPMFGPDSGKYGVEGLPMILDRVRCSDETFRWWSEEFARWGLKVLHMSCEQHDREAAWSQGITHFIGRTLSELSARPTELATTGYKTLLTVMEQTCNDPIQLFYDLQRYNPYAKQMRMGLKGAIEVVMEQLRRQEEQH